jgi:hypothetical protein
MSLHKKLNCLWSKKGKVALKILDDKLKIAKLLGVTSIQPLKFYTKVSKGNIVYLSSYLIEFLKQFCNLKIRKGDFVWMKVDNEYEYATRIQFPNNFLIKLPKSIESEFVTIEVIKTISLVDGLKRGNNPIVIRNEKRVIDVYSVLPKYTRKYEFTRNGVVKEVNPTPIVAFENNGILMFYQTSGKNACFFKISRFMELSSHNIEQLGSYFAEGKKSTSNIDLAITNSNPDIINDFKKFAEELFLINKIDWHVPVQTGKEKSHDAENKIIEFWMEKLNAAKSQIKIYWNHPNTKVNYGVATIRVGNKIAKEIMNSLICFFLNEWKMLKPEYVRSFLNGIECRDTAVYINDGRVRVSFANKYLENTTAVRDMYISLGFHPSAISKTKELYSFEIARLNDMFKMIYYNHFSKNVDDFSKLMSAINTYQGKILCFLSKRESVERVELFKMFNNRPLASQIKLLKDFDIITEESGVIRLRNDFRQIAKGVVDKVETKAN